MIQGGLLYHTVGSAPCRAVRMLAKELGVELELRCLDVFAGDHMKPDFLEINPQHTLPTLVDGDFVLSESRAILTYLMNKYAPESDLYPQHIKARAQVERLLYYDMGMLYKSMLDVFLAPIFGFFSPEDSGERLKGVLVFLDEHILGDNAYITGDKFTIADISIGASLTLLEASNYVIALLQLSKGYISQENASQFAFEFGFPDAPRLEKFYEERIKSLPYFYEVNAEGIDALRKGMPRQETKNENENNREADATPENAEEAPQADVRAGLETPSVEGCQAENAEDEEIV
ncbi:glutathione S-transferase 1-1-like [Varroa jacobsoni]|uniref:glutathione S-transferase 1-1-like n=1 Tax=Varroa jacobsoni TaxID=62625 RepID=UPI000BF8D5F4|nr:glutathione S-transferase 1-1-like [Varroa jacobsoni]